jgi:putative transcriptional regulator
MDKAAIPPKGIFKTNHSVSKRCSKGIIAISLLSIVSLMILLTLPAGNIAGHSNPSQIQVLMSHHVKESFSSPGFLISQSTLAKGKFLVAGRDLIDPNFSETVVLLTSYDWNGAMGLVINRPADVKLAKVIPDIKGIRRRNDKVYLGGPVERDQLIMLIRSDNFYDDTVHVSDDIYVSMSRKVLEKLIKDSETGEKFRVYAGYSGWASGQLEHEVDRGDWHIVDADAETVFDKDTSIIWKELINRTSAQWVRLDHL